MNPSLVCVYKYFKPELKETQSFRNFGRQNNHRWLIVFSFHLCQLDLLGDTSSQVFAAKFTAVDYFWPITFQAGLTL